MFSKTKILRLSKEQIEGIGAFKKIAKAWPDDECGDELIGSQSRPAGRRLKKP